MRKDKLIRVLKLLTSSEMKKFNEFVASPYFNKNKKCIALLDLLFPFFPLFTNEILDEPNFADSVYSEKRSLGTTKSDLLRLLEKFLIQEKFKDQNELQAYFLLEELRERKDDKQFALIYKKSKVAISKKNKNNILYYGEYLLEISQLEMLYQQMSDQNTKASQLNKVILAFEKYCLSNHLLLDNAVLNTRELGSATEKAITEKLVERSKSFIDLAQLKPYENEVLIQLRLHLNRLLNNRKESDFTLFLDNFRKSHASISDLDKRHFNKFIVNHCVIQIIEGDSSYYEKLFNVYMFAIETNTLIEGKYLYPNSLRNIITTSVKAGKLDKAYDLLDSYIDSVDPVYRDVTEIYCKGYLYYQQKDFPVALDYLKKCMDLKSLYELEAEAITYKIHYETNQNWAFDVPIKSFSVKLLRHRKKQSKYIIEGYVNFFRLLKQIYKKKNDPTYTKSKKELISSIEKKEYLSDKRWLKEKVNELD